MNGWNEARPITFDYWENPSSERIGDSPTDFLERMSGPTHIHISGVNSKRSRAVVTLLHGNEPSGCFAIYRLLKEKIVPAVDLHLFIASVQAAQKKPGFAYRMLPGHKDLNRCFGQPFGDEEQDRLAENLISALSKLEPESVLDIHNTSGSGPAFGVTTFMDSRHDALVSLFSHRLIVTDLKLGSLMEISESMMPTVTIECGGAQDQESHLLAYEGIRQYMQLEDVLTLEKIDLPLEVFANPIRLELKSEAHITYADRPMPNTAVTLLPIVENYNFGTVNTETHLGYVNESLSSVLQAKDSKGLDRLADFFCLKNGGLYPARELKLFMVTTNNEIAKKDCLLYFVPAM